LTSSQASSSSATSSTRYSVPKLVSGDLSTRTDSAQSLFYLIQCCYHCLSALKSEALARPPSGAGPPAAPGEWSEPARPGAADRGHLAALAQVATAGHFAIHQRHCGGPSVLPPMARLAGMHSSCTRMPDRVSFEMTSDNPAFPFPDCQIVPIEKVETGGRTHSLQYSVICRGWWSEPAPGRTQPDMTKLVRPRNAKFPPGRRSLLDSMPDRQVISQSINVDLRQDPNWQAHHPRGGAD
jgi:hypothetical protein